MDNFSRGRAYVCVCVCVSVCLCGSACLSVSVCLSVCLFIRLSHCLCLRVCLHVIHPPPQRKLTQFVPHTKPTFVLVKSCLYLSDAYACIQVRVCARTHVSVCACVRVCMCECVRVCFTGFVGGRIFAKLH